MTCRGRRPLRPSLGFAQRALEVAVGLQEGLLGEVLGVMVVANSVVAVRVHVAQMRFVELSEPSVELGFALWGPLGQHMLSLHSLLKRPAPTDCGGCSVR